MRQREEATPAEEEYTERVVVELNNITKDTEKTEEDAEEGLVAKITMEM